MSSPVLLVMYDFHIYLPVMSAARTANLLGAAVTALNDELESATASAAAHGAAFPAALVSVHWEPGLSIEQLRRIVGLSHSGTVRLLDRLEREGAVERKAGRDGRSVAVHLTAQGRRQVRTILDRRRSVMGGALDLLAPAEQDQLRHLVEKMLAGMTRDREHSDHICRLCDLAACPGAACPVECAVQGERS
jgi:MarR family transcriptional regulator, negative regulator of the multidrug operon emrRAB